MSALIGKIVAEYFQHDSDNPLAYRPITKTEFRTALERVASQSAAEHAKQLEPEVRTVKCRLYQLTDGAIYCETDHVHAKRSLDDDARQNWLGPIFEREVTLDDTAGSKLLKTIEVTLDGTADIKYGTLGVRVDGAVTK